MSKACKLRRCNTNLIFCWTGSSCGDRPPQKPHLRQALQALQAQGLQILVLQVELVPHPFLLVVQTLLREQLGLLQALLEVCNDGHLLRCQHRLVHHLHPAHFEADKCRHSSPKTSTLNFGCTGLCIARHCWPERCHQPCAHCDMQCLNCIEGKCSL